MNEARLLTPRDRAGLTAALAEAGSRAACSRAAPTWSGR